MLNESFPGRKTSTVRNLHNLFVTTVKKGRAESRSARLVNFGWRQVLAEFTLLAQDKMRNLPHGNAFVLLLERLYVSQNTQNCQVEFPQTCHKGGVWAEWKALTVSFISG